MRCKKNVWITKKGGDPMQKKTTKKTTRKTTRKAPAKKRTVRKHK